ncbi:MAG: hypothetical protein JGK08_04295 [Microcoleus sp. PH2017_04_SCI_O_A]|nr:hypothetical protein [Microcoleus sp. PH2017_04_SCI_O_A]MCC3509248.1 hypothetical protein [Microcoleus sp. PH2017_17_BER_D_A]
MKASGFGVEIKRRRFITPILGLTGRGRPQAVNCQLSTVNCQLLKHSGFHFGTPAVKTS